MYRLSSPVLSSIFASVCVCVCVSNSDRIWRLLDDGMGIMSSVAEKKDIVNGVETKKKKNSEEKSYGFGKMALEDREIWVCGF